jgi:hypothetical protein
MSNPIVNYPIYTSYVYQHEHYTIFTHQRTEWNGDLSLFSTIISPGRPTKHCWTSGTTHGCEYRIRSEYSTPSEPGRGHVYTSSIFLPTFAYQLALHCPDTTAPFVSGNLTEYPDPSCPPAPSVEPTPLPICEPTHASGSSPTFIPCGVADAYSGAPIINTPLPHPIDSESTLGVQRPHPRGSRRHTQKMLRPSTSYGDVQ